MKLCLKNIGKIEDAEIEINGITVIGGENDTGKSTVGKALFSVFNSFYEIQYQINEEKISSIQNILQYVYLGAFFTMPSQSIIINDFARKILLAAEQYITAPNLLKEDIISTFHLSAASNRIITDRISIEDGVARIIEILQVADEDVFKEIVLKNLSVEFCGQPLNVDSQSGGTISLQIQKEKLNISVAEDSISVSGLDYHFHTKAIYIDDPFLINRAVALRGLKRDIYPNHQEQLIDTFLNREFYNGVVDEIIVENKIKKIFEKLESVCDGKLIQQKDGLLVFQRENSDAALNANNLSTGLKTFVILKSLLENGVIKQNGTIILDEPEIHLHPEWQLLFAEIIVLLNKEFGVNILLNTHSPYFLRAIQVYSAKYERSDVCKYYLSELDGKGKAHMTDVTDNVDKIFAKLADPLQKLEDERWKND